MKAKKERSRPEYNPQPRIRVLMFMGGLCKASSEPNDRNIAADTYISGLFELCMDTEQLKLAAGTR